MKPNEHGGFIIRQSDLASWARCNLQKKYQDEANADPTKPQGKELSATVFGTVVHYALMVMEKLVHAKKDNALDVAIATFDHYWDPRNIGEVAAPVDTWLPRQTYGGMRERGRGMLTQYYDLLVKDDSKLLGLEYQFSVPLEANGRLHTLTGTIDRMSIRKFYGTPYLSIEDHKTGKQPNFLRHNMQGTAYSYASLQPEFWSNPQHQCFDKPVLDGIERYLARFGYRLHEGTKTSWWNGPMEKTIETVAARRFRWINLQEIKMKDAGWRGPIDYERLRLAVDQYVQANEAGIYSPNLAGEVCVHCPFQHFCGGTGIPAKDHGEPARRYSTKA